MVPDEGSDAVPEAVVALDALRVLIFGFQIWYSGFRFDIRVSNLRFGFQIWYSGIRFEIWVSGLRFGFQV